MHPFLYVLSTVLVLSTVGTEPRVSIHVSSRNVYVDQALRIRCTVPHNPDNRFVEAAIDDSQYSQRPLEGEFAAITNDFFFDHLQCVDDRASCAVRTMNRSDAVASLSITVVGCGPE
jgi:hypothetical protein